MPYPDQALIRIGEDRDGLAQQLHDLHAECDIDGYGDEGAGYDMRQFADLLLAHGWVPPPTLECACPGPRHSQTHRTH